jgi:hypothetical protein
MNRWRVTLRGRPARGRSSVFVLVLGSRRSRFAADGLAERARGVWPSVDVRVEEVRDDGTVVVGRVGRVGRVGCASDGKGKRT